MFEDASSFNQPLDNWEVSNVMEMRGMFENAESFNQPLNNWHVASVHSIYDRGRMFAHASSFNQPLHAPWYDPSDDDSVW